MTEIRVNHSFELVSGEWSDEGERNVAYAIRRRILVDQRILDDSQLPGTFSPVEKDKIQKIATKKHTKK